MKNPTTEQLKAEAIKKAWIAEIGEEAYNTISSLIRKDDGFAHGRAFTQFKHNGSPLQSVIFNGYLHYRPISIKCLESNNGWTRIEPDGSNLPEIEGDYLFCNNRNERFYLKDFDPKIHDVKTYTHYKLLDFKYPIY